MGKDIENHVGRRTAPGRRQAPDSGSPDIGPALRLDRELLAEARRVQVGRLELAEGIERLIAAGGWQALGYPTLESYGRERLGRSGRWLADARALARRLAELPVVREAFVCGRSSVSKAELVARICHRRGETDEAEQAGWVETGEALTVRQLRRLLSCDAMGSDVRERWARDRGHRPAPPGHRPGVRRALAAARVGFEAATLIGRVGRPHTIEAWVDLAAKVTVKQLREHIDSAELDARIGDRPIDRVRCPGAGRGRR